MERRKGNNPIPENIGDFLNSQQLKALQYLRPKGIVLFAIRRPLFQEKSIILKNLISDKFEVMLSDGKLDYSPDITVRP